MTPVVIVSLRRTPSLSKTRRLSLSSPATMWLTGGGGSLLLCALLLFVAFATSPAFQSDELLDDDEFEGVLRPPSPSDPDRLNQVRPPTRRRSDPDAAASSDSKAVQFSLEHALGGDFSPAGTFTARLKTWSNGVQTLTKLRFSRNDLTDAEKEAFKRLLKEDDYYTIRVPSNVLNPPGEDYIVSSVKARCLPRGSLDEHFVIHMDGVNILAVNYGSAGACPYPRLLRLPTKWSFNSYTVLKNSEQAPRTPIFAEELVVGENGEGEGEGVKPPEKSFWAKYWMYLIPLGLIVMNAVTQIMNMPEEQAGGQPGSHTQQAALPRAPNAAVRRR